MKKQENSCFFMNNSNRFISLFKALGEPNRLGLLKFICSKSKEHDSSLNVNEFKTCCDVDLSVISRHLNVLKEAGVLSYEKKGKEVFYSLNAKDLAKSLRDLADEIEKSAK